MTSSVLLLLLPAWGCTSYDCFSYCHYRRCHAHCRRCIIEADSNVFLSFVGVQTARSIADFIHYLPQNAHHYADIMMMLMMITRHYDATNVIIVVISRRSRRVIIIP